MSKKDYELIAGEILRVRELVTSHVAVSAVERVATNLASAFEDDNERFDKKRFLVACGVGK